MATQVAEVEQRLLVQPTVPVQVQPILDKLATQPGDDKEQRPHAGSQDSAQKHDIRRVVDEESDQDKASVR